MGELSEGPGPFTELCDALAGKFCIAHDTTEFVDYRRRKPWTWEKHKSWWELEIERRENRRIRQMLGAGSGSYIYDLNDEGKIDDKHTGAIKFLVVETVLQPHTPQEHDIFAAIVKHHDDDEMTLEGGALKVKILVPVPELEAVGTSVALKSDMDAKRAEEAAAKQKEEDARKKAQEESAAKAAEAQGVKDATLIETAARAGAVAAAEVLKGAQNPTPVPFDKPDRGGNA